MWMNCADKQIELFSHPIDRLATSGGFLCQSEPNPLLATESNTRTTATGPEFQTASCFPTQFVRGGLNLFIGVRYVRVSLTAHQKAANTSQRTSIQISRKIEIPFASFGAIDLDKEILLGIIF